MRGRLRKSMIAAMALLIVAGTTVAVPNSASARWGGGWHGGGWHGGGWRGGGWGWGGVGLGIGTGLLLAAAVSAPYYGGYGYNDPYYYGYGPAYGYGPYGYGYRRAYYGYSGYYPRYRYAGYPYRRHYYRSVAPIRIVGTPSLRTARHKIILERPPWKTDLLLPAGRSFLRRVDVVHRMRCPLLAQSRHRFARPQCLLWR